ncbi:hypothetical protein BH18ACT4_BH18ACT4_15070 [soil metagenome]
MSDSERPSSLLVPVVVFVAVIVVAGSVVRFVLGTVFGAIRLLAVIVVAAAAIVWVLRRKGQS